MILGFSGVNYTGWLYIARVARLFAGAAGVKPARTGWVAAIPFLAAAVGMWVNGTVVDATARRGYDQAKPANGDCYRSGAVGAGHLAGGAIVHASPCGGFYLHGAVLRSFCRDVRPGLVQVMVAEHKVASVAAIQNFGSFVFASFAPIVPGWVVDTTHSFNLALVIAAGVTFAGALCYFFIVKTRID